MALRSDVKQVLKELSRASGVYYGELSRRFHQIKDRGAAPLPDDANWIDDSNGNVYDGAHGTDDHYIGNVFNDF